MNMKIKTVIVEDIEVELKFLRNILNKFEYIDIVEEARNGQEALDLIYLRKPELIFVDIHLPLINGFEIANRIFNTAYYKPLIVFITVDKYFALNAFELNSVDYILKPYDETRLHQTLLRVYERFMTQEKLKNLQKKTLYESPVLHFSQKDKSLVIPLNNIIFIETDKKKHAIIHTKAKKHTIRENLRNIENRLTGYPNFLRVHRSYFVNLYWIERIESFSKTCNRIVFRNYSGEALLSKNKMDKVKEQTINI